MQKVNCTKLVVTCNWPDAAARKFARPLAAPGARRYPPQPQCP